MSSLESWLNEQITTHNIRVSPRLPLDDRVKHFMLRWAAQNGRQLDETDAELAAMLVSMHFNEVIDVAFILDQLHMAPSSSWNNVAAPQRRRSRRHQ